MIFMPLSQLRIVTPVGLVLVHQLHQLLDRLQWQDSVKSRLNRGFPFYHARTSNSFAPVFLILHQFDVAAIIDC